MIRDGCLAAIRMDKTNMRPFLADHGGVVLEDVADEEDLLFRFGQMDKGCAFVVGQGQGLFDEAVFAGIEGLRGQGVVLGGGGGDDDGFDVGIGE